MNLAPGTKLGPYEILKHIGAGGMGEVWKARDTRLGRIVAIKKVKEQHSERFKQEAKSIAALNHPNICQIHDIGDDYLVLEYIDGKPLSSPLPEKEAVRLAIQIAAALEAAHKKVIIHRDLKPSNIMVTDEGSVKLLDFGLAKLYEQDAATSQSPTADFPATQAGVVLGTVAYMSPEQAQGQSADARSDIFSFGLVMYEMLSGRRAFSGDSTPAVMAALLRDEPPPLQTSPPLEKIVRHCLAKQPSARYQAIAEVRTALEALSREMEAKSSTEPQPSIAVLPFVNMSGDKEQEYFSDGLAEEIINALTKIPGLKVPARTSSFFFRGREADIQEISARLNVRAVLEGSVRKSGNRLRVTAQLINAADGYHLWSERYDREMTDVFAIQDEISQAIVEKLRVGLSAERHPFKRYTENVDAYNLYLKGRYHLYKATAEHLEKCRKHFEQAIAIDPHYALAWRGLAEGYWRLGLLGFMPPKSANERSFDAVIKALELNEMLAEAHSMMAILRASQYDWKGAEQEFSRALELDPGSVDVWSNYSKFYLAPMRRMDEAVDAARKALQLEPLSSYLQYQLGELYFSMRQYDRALEQCRSAIELDPQYPWSHVVLGSICVEKGEFDEGIQACQTAVQLGKRSGLLLTLLCCAFAAAGRPGEARILLAEMRELAQKTYTPPICFAWIYAALGELDTGLVWLEKAVDEHVPGQIVVSPFTAPLRSHPRYRALLRRMNLEA